LIQNKKHMWIQKTISIPAHSRGFHIITHEILRQVPEIKEISVGTAHLFLQHTSASLSINENADPDVRVDMESHMNKMIPENAPYYTHTLEGSDDMPAHIKSSVLGVSLTVPISQGTFNLGIWQGIYLCEHRDHGSRRGIVVTVNGEK
jgi:secondary thiamine-phosphate synthase enzyme